MKKKIIKCSVMCSNGCFHAGWMWKWRRKRKAECRQVIFKKCNPGFLTIDLKATFGDFLMI